VNITLLEAAQQLLSTFDVALREYTLRLFRRQQIDVRLNSIVTGVGDREVHLDGGSTIPFGMVVWSTGVVPDEFVRSLPFAKTQQHRILVDEFLRVKGYANVYALGDCATLETINLPVTSQVAQQEGKYLARLLNNSAVGKSYKRFRYRHYGMLAYIGSNRALADLATLKGKGFTTWLFWRSTYLTKLLSWKNKILVVFDWCKTLIFGRDISRF
jgi:NADH:ubiquinone reductase (non-electrogenic)